jgi:hypothetical protein
MLHTGAIFGVLADIYIYPGVVLGIATQKSLSFIDWGATGCKHCTAYTEWILDPKKFLFEISCLLGQFDVY